MADIYIFGDSITLGAFDERGGWVDRIKQDFMRQKLQDINLPTVQVVNLGIGGDIADDIATRVENEIQARYKRWSSQADIFVVAVGVNDSRLQGLDSEPVSSPENYAQQLELITKKIQQYSKNIIFIGLTPVIDEVFAPPHETVYKNERVVEFNKALEKYCQANNYPLVDIYEPMSKLNVTALLPDGLHPNTEGHTWMYEQIKPYVMKFIKLAPYAKIQV